MKARLLGGIAAIVLAIFGSVLLISYVNGADARAAEGTETGNVVVVQKEIAAGTAVSSFGDAIKIKAIPKNLIVDGALVDLASVQDKVASMKLLPGDQVSDQRLSDASTFADVNPVKVPETMQQMSFVVSTERVVGGQLRPGDQAALFLSYNQGIEPGTGEIPATKMTLRKTLVVSMQAAGSGSSNSAAAPDQPQAITPPDTVGAPSWVVTVALAPADAIKLVHAAEFGHIWVAKDAAGTTGTSPDPLFKGDVFK